MMKSDSRPPRMDLLLDRSERLGLIDAYGRRAVKNALERAMGEARETWRAGAEAPGVEDLLDRAGSILGKAFRKPLNPVVNATGVILHTNLGRAPLCKAHLKEAAEVLSGYVDVELDLGTGSRGHRDLRLEAEIRSLLDTEHGIVAVNNNAAAVILTLSTLASGKEALVSRGELVEIGGSFRIPDVMAASGAILREVGTTNRTRLSDYENALGERTGVLMKVHPSNYRIEGFTQSVPVADLVALGRKRGVPVAHDLGSGCLQAGPGGLIEEELSVEAALGEGPDVLTFSGDKLFGASQAGLLLIAPPLVKRFRSNPLLRALRLDKVSYWLLGKAVQAYRKDRWAELPALEMLAASRATLRRGAHALKRRVERAAPGRYAMEVAEGEGRVGGGTAPIYPLPSPILRIRPERGSVRDLDEYMRRQCDPAVVSVAAEDSLHLHLRTILPGQLGHVAACLATYADKDDTGASND